MNSNDIIQGILRREGGYVNHPADKDGPTNHGITQATLSAWLGHAASVAEVKTLTAAEAAHIYRERYLVKPGFDQVSPDHLQALLLDSAVNHGIGWPIKWLQNAIGGLVVDGVMGPHTQAALKAVLQQPGAGNRLYDQVLAQRAKFYGHIITHNPSQAVFAAGWMSRLAEFIKGV